MEKLLKGLNSQQTEAVKHKDGPLLVVAGAGTGKTTVITRRIAWLITKEKVAPSSILALTFTDKAAGEMETRVDKLVPYGYIDTWISTFHAFADRILREHSLEVGLTPNYTVLNQSEQAVFLREHIFDFDIEHFRPLSGPTKHIAAIVEHINNLKDEAILPERYIEFAQVREKEAKDEMQQKEAQRTVELARIYANYQELLLANDLIDFGDQILRAITLLKENPKILSAYQKQFKYCLVDEFQDTNPAQNELLKLLFGPKAPHQNITVVGDDDQSIYQFRGAAVQNILDFRTTWPKAKTIVLNQNYRSSQPILDSAYELIKFNNPERLEIKAKINKKLKSATGDGVVPEFNIYDDDYSEARAIIRKINEHIENGSKYSDIAILVRANAQTNFILHQLRSENVPYIAPGSSGLYDEPVIRLILCFARVIANYDDYASYYFLATSEAYAVSTTTMTSLSSFIRRNNLNFRRALENLRNSKDLLERAENEHEKIEFFIKDVNEYMEFARTHNVGEVIYRWLDKTGYLKNLIARAQDDIVDQIALENIASFYEKIKDFVRSSDNASIQRFVDNLNLLIEAGENPALSQDDININAVSLVTIHSAKGLEWDVVFLPSLADDRFPARHRKKALPVPESLLSSQVNKDIHIQEERRLFYVALTRAKKHAYLSVAKRYDRGVREKKTSRFVIEALGTKAGKKDVQPRADIIEKLSLFDVNTKPLQKRELVFDISKRGINPHQLDDYLTCPKKFEFVHILKVPLAASWHVQYGNTIHQAIGFYFAGKQKGKVPKLEDVITNYNKVWSSEGYVSHEHEAAKRKLGEKTLREFYAREQEKNRVINAVELPFEFPFGGIKIRGRYDIVFGKENKIIADFKTSDVDDEKKALERVRQSTQMQVYSLAEEIITGKRPIVALYFVESGIMAEHKFSDKEVEKTKKNVKSIIESIKQQNFTATPGYHQCHWCAFNSICPYRQKGS